MGQSRFCDHCGALVSSQAKFCGSCGHSLATVGAGQPVSPSPAPHATGLLPSSSILAQRYLIVRRVGKGGMGAVYEALDNRFSNRRVAIKEMSKSGLAPSEVAEATKAFQDEANLLANLKNPALPVIYDWFSEGSDYYLVMEYIDGQTLEALCASSPNKTLPLDVFFIIGDQLCEVLNYLHTQNPPIIFRDLKPANVMISQNKKVYLIDFGIARFFKSGQSRDTVALGTVGYAPPEQHGKAQTTVRSDIYSLGATFHFMLTGKDPSDTPFNFQPVSTFRSDVPSSLDELVKQMVQIEVGKRPESAAAVRQQLWQIVQQQTSGNSQSSQAQSPHQPNQQQSATNGAKANSPYSQFAFTPSAPIPNLVKPSMKGWEAMSLSGLGTTTSRPFRLKEGIMLIYVQHTGNRLGLKVLSDRASRKAPFFIWPSNHSAWRAYRLSDSGEYVCEVSCDGNWSIQIEQSSNLASLAYPEMKPGWSMQNNGSTATGLFIFKRGSYTFRTIYQGQGYAAVWLLGENDKKLHPLAKASDGRIDVTTTTWIEQTGIYVLDVNLNGNWSIKLL